MVQGFDSLVVDCWYCIYADCVAPTGFSWYGTATMWMVPAGTMVMLASIVYSVLEYCPMVVVGLTPTELACSASEQDGMQAQSGLPSVGYYQTP